MAFEFRLPDIGEGVVEGEIVKWMVAPGDHLEEDQPMVEVMTDKATVEIPSPVEGRVVSMAGGEGQIVEVGAVLVVIEEKDGSKVGEQPRQIAAAKPIAEEGKAPKAEVRIPGGRVLATPAVRRLAREMAIDMTQVTGSGAGGRVTRQDLELFAAGSAGTPDRPHEAPTRAPGGVRKIPYRALRKKIGDRLALSKRQAPHFTYVEEVDVTTLVELRRRALGKAEVRDAQLTYLPFIIRAVIEGLKKFPMVNSSLDEEAGEILIKEFFNIGVAVATPNGLIVPVVRDADCKSVLDLSREISELAAAARENRIAVEDLRDGTFTITSLGPLGGLMATPIINHPEVAILGVHKISKRAVVREGKVVVRDMMNLSVSMDHRVVDGLTGAQFLNDIIPYIENPGLLLV